MLTKIQLENLHNRMIKHSTLLSGGNEHVVVVTAKELQELLQMAAITLFHHNGEEVEF